LTLRTAVTRAASVSLFNPHAILDTVGVIGAALAASVARRFFTPRQAVRFDRISGLILLIFAVFLAIEFVPTVL
jgi:L-lysine exporter family protein LysE/ArgO